VPLLHAGSVVRSVIQQPVACVEGCCGIDIGRCCSAGRSPSDSLISLSGIFENAMSLIGF
jgi:hypothetical protein